MHVPTLPPARSLTNMGGQSQTFAVLSYTTNMHVLCVGNYCDCLRFIAMPVQMEFRRDAEKSQAYSNIKGNINIVQTGQQ